jgi:heme exporter protein C
MALVTAAAFLYLPAAQGFMSPEMARILAFHLPNAMVVIIAAVASGYYAFRYLAKGRSLLDDARSKVAASLATLFCVLTTVTGMVFAQVQWGAAWNWDPKQTCIFILLLIYAAYFVLRSGIEDPEKRAAVAAVYVLFAAVMTPMLGYVVPKYMAPLSLHPKQASLSPEYHSVVWSFTAGLIGLYAWLHNIAFRQERLRLALLTAEAED